MGRRIIPLKGKRRRPGLPHPPAPPPRLHLKGDIARTVGVIRLLLETPSGFGIFSFDGTYLKKDNELVSNLKGVIWLKEFIRFENKSTAINLETGVIHVDLINMLKKWCDSEEKLAVGRAEYKMIIERKMEITCLYDQNVEEVMWGLKNNMQFLVPQEKTKLTEKDCVPISKGLERFLIQYKIDMNPEMVNVHVAQQAGIIHRTDLALKKHSAFFKLVGESLKSISDIDNDYISANNVDKGDGRSTTKEMKEILGERRV
nr:probable nucleolar protein 5-1 [Aegilops tauschii subsp. strangulata]